jgi:hypothetical protein
MLCVIYMDKMKVTELKAEARKRKIKGFSKMKKAELLAALEGGKAEPKGGKTKPKPDVIDEDDLDLIAELYVYLEKLDELDMVNTNGPDDEKDRKIIDKEIQLAKDKTNKVIRRVDKKYKLTNDKKLLNSIIKEAKFRWDTFNKPGKPVSYYGIGFDVKIDDGKKYADAGGLRIDAVYNSMPKDLDDELKDLLKDLKKFKKNKKKKKD